MMPGSADKNAASWQKLADSLSRNDAALVLGAGVSVDSGIPLWKDLVSQLVDAANLPQKQRDGLLDLRSSGIPDPTILSLLKKNWTGHRPWLDSVAGTLYAKVEESLGPEDFDKLREAEMQRSANNALATKIASNNPTLAAIVDLCARPSELGWRPSKHVASVLTFNLDGLVQLYDRCKHGSPRIFRTIERASKRRYQHSGARKQGKIGLYHLHGYLLPDGFYGGQARDTVVLCEDEYVKRNDEPFSFANTTLLACLQQHVCIFIGCSMTDEIMRRALHRSRSEVRNALQAEDDGRRVDNRVLRRHFAVVPRSAPPKRSRDAARRTDTKKRLDSRESWTKKSLDLLGVRPLWVNPDYSHLPQRLSDLKKLLE